MLDDVDQGADDANSVIDLPNVDEKTLELVNKFCSHYNENKGVTLEWEATFFDVPTNVMIDLMIASNYLDIPPLLDLSCKSFAKILKSKTPEEICLML